MKKVLDQSFTLQKENRINVTKSFLPKPEEYFSILHKIFESHSLSNRGPLVLELEKKLKYYFGVEYLTLMSNGTLPLHIAIKVLGLSGEIITSPFSYVSSTSAIVWENCIPVFADIESSCWTLEPESIERCITSSTRAILATHVFGNPCDIEAIEKIAEHYHLKVIYDGAHSFGVTYKSKSLLSYGDLSSCSFHATKPFHTGEGGCLITSQSNLYEKIDVMHNCGHAGTLGVQGLGINAKMSEVNAALGLSLFPYIEKNLELRKALYALYFDYLLDLDLQFIQLREGTNWNYYNFPIVFSSESQLLRVVGQLNLHNIFPRRYFYPTLNHLPYVKNKETPVAEYISARILCLPFSPYLGKEEVEKICTIIRKNLS